MKCMRLLKKVKQNISVDNQKESTRSKIKCCRMREE